MLRRFSHVALRSFLAAGFLVLTNIASADVAQCPPNRIVSAGNDCLGLLWNLTGEIQSTNPSAIKRITQTPPPASRLPLGTNQIVFTVTFTNNQTYTCATLFIVADTTPPTFAAVTNRTVDCETEWEFETPLAADLCGTNTVNVLSTVTNSTGMVTYEATRIWQAIDAYGNTSTATQLVMVVDQLPPVITLCPTNRALAAGNNCLLVLPDLTSEIVATDACSTVTFHQNPAPGTELGFGTHLIEFTVLDEATNAATCSLTLNVIDNTAPIIDPITNIVLTAGIDCTAALPNLTNEVTATDCSPFTITQSPLEGVKLPLGTNEVVFTVTDTNGVSATRAALVIVVDAVPPVFAALSARSYECDAPWQFDVPTATDLCTTTAVNIVSTRTNATGSTTFVAERIWEAIDAYGNTATATQLVSVVDTTLPVITDCPPDLSLDVGANCVLSLPNLATGLVATDACGSVSVTQSPAPGTELPLGSHLITFSVQDPATNIATCSLTLTVVDNTAPVINALPNFTASVGTNCVVAVPDLTSQVTAIDCSPYTVTQSPLPGVELPVGTNEMTFTVTDTNHLIATATTLLMVRDTTPPEIAGLTNRTVDCDETWEFDEATATDWCTTNTIRVLATITNAAGPGTLTASRIWEATDEYGNTGTATQLVSVIDTSVPVISHCPPNRALGAGATCLLSLPDWTSELLSTLSCGGGVSVSQSPVPGTPMALGTHLVTFTAQGAGDAATCSLTLEVTNNATPVIEALTNQLLSAGADCKAILPDLTTNLTYLVCGPHTITQVPAPEAELPLGTNEVLFTVTATNGQTATSTVLVIVSDTIPPVFAALADRTVQCAATWNFDVATATDACGTNRVTIVSTVTNTAGPSTFVAARVWEAVDAVGNTSTATQTVTVIDSSVPVITHCPVDRTLGANANCGLILPDFTSELTVTTGCGNVTVVQSPSPGVELALGQRTITFTVQDDAANTATCSFTLSVVDATPPAMSASTNFILYTAENCAAVLPELVGLVTVTDCSAYTVAQDPLPGVELQLGTNLVTFTAQDALNQSSVLVHPVIVMTPPSANTNLSLSEFMAKNLTSITDEDGAHSDWIELYNAGSCPLNLDGWFLTDDTKKPAKWRFPGTNIAAGQYLIVWASEKNRRVPGAPLHTNFKLSDEGEYLALVQPNGTIATRFTPTFPAQLPDGTYGQPPGGGTNDYLARSTPGAPNATATNFAIAAMTFKPARGWYSSPVEVSLSTPTKYTVSGLKIYYTTNGSVPSPTNGVLYTQRLLISSTTVVRAAAFAEGMVPTVPQSHSYIFPQQVLQQTGAGFPPKWGTFDANYGMLPTIVDNPEWRGIIPQALISMPTVSLSMNPEDIFGTNGIYTNPFGDGNYWERPCSIEYLRNDSEPDLQINCGIQLQGELSRDPEFTLKHGFRLYFKQDYGAAKLIYGLYPESPVNDFNTLVLHPSFNDHWIFFGPKAQMLKSQWLADTQREIGEYGTHGTYVNLYINGLYWGLYNLGEQPSAAYAASYLGGVRADYDGFNADELKDGNTNSWNEMVSLVRAGITNETTYAELADYLDLPSFADYMLINMYAANLDWPAHNFWLLGSVTNGIPFRFISWDAEGTFYGINEDLTDVDAGTPGLFYTKLRQYPEFRRLFGDRAHQLLFDGGALTPQRTANRWMQRAHEIESAIVAESARWGVTYQVTTRNEWLEEQNYLMSEWFPRRTDILIAQLRAAHLYPTLEAPTISPHGGLIYEHEPRMVALTTPVGVIYYTTNGTDPKQGDGTPSDSALLYHEALALTSTTHLSARTFATNSWSALVEAQYGLAEQTPIRIENVTRRIDRTIQLKLAGFPGIAHTLYGSANLTDWTVITTLVPDEHGRYQYVDTTAANESLRFYKLTTP